MAVVWLVEAVGSVVRSMVTKALGFIEVTFNGMFVVVSSVLAYMSVTLRAAVASLGTVGILAAVFVVKSVLSALAVLLLAAIALLVAVRFSSMVAIVVVVVSVRAILISIMMAALVSKAVFAVRAMREMTIVNTVVEGMRLMVAGMAVVAGVAVL